MYITAYVVSRIVKILLYNFIELSSDYVTLDKNVDAEHMKLADLSNTNVYWVILVKKDTWERKRRKKKWPKFGF